MEDERSRGAVLALDGGDALLKELPIPTVMRAQFGDKADVVARVYGRLLDAFVPGELDVGDNAAWMVELLQRYKVPVVAANLVGKDGKRVFPPFLLKNIGGLKVLVVGAVDATLWPAGVSVLATDPVAAIEQALKDAPSHDVAVLLAHATSDTAGAWASASGAFALVGAGHGGTIFFHPKVAPSKPGARVPQALLLSAGKGGKYLGKLRVVHVPGEAGYRGGDAYARLRLQLDNARRRLVDNPKDQGALTAQAELSAVVAEDERHAHADWDLVGLEQEMPEVPEISALVAAYNARNAQREAGLMAGVTAVEAPPPGSPYVGLKVCVVCHQEQNAVWVRTKHAHAMESLKRTNQGLDRECISCHTTGFGEPGGFREPSTMGGFLEVQCEACHGPGRNHVQSNGGRGTIQRSTPEATCLRCHTPELTPQFRFTRDREHIRHWKGP